MKFSHFSQYLQKLEDTSKRLEITSILAELIKELEVQETENAVNLALGQLKAPFNTQRFSMADKMIIRVLELAYQKPAAEVDKLYGKSGDLGNVAESLCTKALDKHLSINEVYEALYKIACLEGTGSQEKKVEHLSTLLAKLDALSAKYVVRMVLGTTRLGFTSLTIIDALSNILAGDKSLKEQIEEKYNVYPDVAYIAKRIKEKGLKGIGDIEMEVGVPLLPQKPQRLGTPEETIEKMGGEVWAEYKFDGTRVQLHMDKNRKSESTEPNLFGDVAQAYVKTFTRNLDETTHQFPDIVEAAQKFIDADSVILDGEAIGYNRDTGEYLNFQDTIQRKRKHGVADMAAQIPLKYLVFDLIYLNGESQLNKPLVERRALLNKIIKKGGIVEVDAHLSTSDPQELGDFFTDAKEKNLEGLVVKNPQSTYQAGARSFAWVKLKRLDDSLIDDTVDCVVLGYYFGKGVRSSFGIGGFLVGLFDKDSGKFKTVTKIGTGLSDEDWVYLKKECDKIKIKDQPANVEVKKELYPDVWVTPKIVVVVRADEISVSTQHTAGYALRFPRLMEFRKDKAPQDSTSTKEIEELYKLQKKS